MRIAVINLHCSLGQAYWMPNTKPVTSAPAPTMQSSRDASAVEDDRAHADERIVADGAAVQDRTMADGAAAADRYRAAGVGVDDRKLLEVALGANDDRLAIAAQDRAEPDADVLAELTPPITLASGAIQNRPSLGRRGRRPSSA